MPFGAESPGALMPHQFSGASFPGIELARNWQKLGEAEREMEREGESAESPGHWLQTPWRRRDASQLLAKHPIPSHPGPRAPSFFMATAGAATGFSSRGTPIKSRLLLARRPPGIPLSSRSASRTSFPLAVSLRTQYYRLNSGRRNSLRYASDERDRRILSSCDTNLITRALSIIMFKGC